MKVGRSQKSLLTENILTTQRRSHKIHRADDATSQRKATEQKHCSEGYLFRLSEMERPDYRHRHAQKYEVTSNVERGIADEETIRVDAASA